MPSSLNTYVEQVNTLKYIEHKRPDFAKKFDNIDHQFEMCRDGNIKVSPVLARAIDEVKHLHENLPKLEKTSKE